MRADSIQNGTQNHVPAIDGEPEGNWILHYFCDELRSILHVQWPDVRRDCNRDDATCVTAHLDRIKNFCLTGVIDSKPPNVGSTTPVDTCSVKRLIHQLEQYCQALAVEARHLDAVGRARLRAAMLQVFRSDVKRQPSTEQAIEFMVAIGAVIAWITVFAIGYTVHARPYEDVIKEPRAVAGGSEIAEFVGALAMFILSSIPTNVLLLSCLAGILGTAYRRATRSGENSGDTTTLQDYVFSITATFFMYVVLIGGLLMLSVADILTNESQEKHLKLAGTASMCAFLVGYDRQFLAWLLRLAASFVTREEAKLTPTMEVPSSLANHGVAEANRAPKGQPSLPAPAIQTGPSTPSTPFESADLSRPITMVSAPMEGR